MATSLSQKIRKTKLIIRHQDPKFLTPALNKFRKHYYSTLMAELNQQLSKLS